MIEVDIRREMTVETDQKYQEKVEAAANIIFQLKQRYYRLAIAVIIFQIKKGHDEMATPYVEEVF